VRLDGRVKDVRPTIKAARDYAKGDLRQDLMDERNASEEEERISKRPGTNLLSCHKRKKRSS
jgi:hypothetical protein